MEPTFIIKTIHTKKMYEDFAKFTYKIRSLTAVFRLCVFIIGFYIIGASLLKNGSKAGYVSLFLGTLILLVLVFRAKLAVFRMIRKNENYKNKKEFVFKFFQNEFVVEGGELPETISYTKIKKSYESSLYFFLCVEGKIFHVIPKADFTLGQPEAFHKFIEMKCKIQLKEPKRDIKKMFGKA